MKHNNSFVNLFNLLSPAILDSAIATNRSDKYSKNMDTKTHLAASMLIQITNPHGLRELEIQLNTLNATLSQLSGSNSPVKARVKAKEKVSTPTIIVIESK